MYRKEPSPVAKVVVASDNTRESELLQSTVDAVTNNSQLLRVLSANTDKDRTTLGFADPSKEQPLAGAAHNYQQLCAGTIQNEHMYTNPDEQITYQPLGSSSPRNDYEVPMDPPGSNERSVSLNVCRQPPDSTLIASHSPETGVHVVAASQPLGSSYHQQLTKAVTTFRMSLRKIDYLFLVFMVVTMSLSALAFIISLSSIASCDCMSASVGTTSSFNSGLLERLSASALYDLSRCVPKPVENCTINLYGLEATRHLVCSTNYMTLVEDDMYTSGVDCVVTGNGHEMHPTTGNLEYDSFSSSLPLSVRCSCTVDKNQILDLSNPLVCHLLVTRCPLL